MRCGLPGMARTASGRPRSFVNHVPRGRPPPSGTARCDGSPGAAKGRRSVALPPTFTVDRVRCATRHRVPPSCAARGVQRRGPAVAGRLPSSAQRAPVSVSRRCRSPGRRMRVARWSRSAQQARSTVEAGQIAQRPRIVCPAAHGLPYLGERATGVRHHARSGSRSWCTRRASATSSGSAARAAASARSRSSSRRCASCTSASLMAADALRPSAVRVASARSLSSSGRNVS